jgi:hypothetical protein
MFSKILLFALFALSARAIIVQQYTVDFKCNAGTTKVCNNPMIFSANSTGALFVPGQRITNPDVATYLTSLNTPLDFTSTVNKIAGLPNFLHGDGGHSTDSVNHLANTTLALLVSSEFKWVTAMSRIERDQFTGISGLNMFNITGLSEYRDFSAQMLTYSAGIFTPGTTNIATVQGNVAQVGGGTTATLTLKRVGIPFEWSAQSSSASSASSAGGNSYFL